MYIPPSNAEHRPEVMLGFIELLSAVEAWSAARGHRFITLNVFAGNQRARAVYERAGYGQDTIRYAKELPAATVPG